MSDRLEEAVVAVLQDLTRSVQADEAFLSRLLETMAEPQHAVRRPRRWLPGASVAAVVVTLALVIAFLVHPSSHRPAPPVHSVPTRSLRATPTPTSTASPTPATPLQKCIVPLPNAWSDGWQGIPPPGSGAVGSFAGLTVLAMTGSGDVVTYSNVASAQAQGALVIVHPDGATRVLYSVPPIQVGQSTADIETAQTDGTWVVFDLVSNYIRTRIEAVKLDSGALLDIATAGPRTQLSVPQLLNGTAYWGELRDNVDAASAGHIYGEALASGARTNVAAGEVSNPTVLGGAVEWSGRNGAVQWLGTPHLPAGYPIIAKPYPLVQDGSSAAWTDWDETGARPLPTVMVHRPDDATPQTAYRGSSGDFDAAHQPRPFALIGTYLVYTDGERLLALDLGTGAAIQLTTFEPAVVRAAAANGTLAIDTAGSKGGSHLFLLPPAALPEPHC